ncbi:Solute carrier family 23 member 2 [Aphelenchoides besseyi]|nr:Solute carrier family 23 member 2 [Aphelenchoides besseyi]
MNAVDDETSEKSNALRYRTNSEIPIVTAMLMGFQHSMVSIAGILHLVADIACAGEKTTYLRSQLISSTLIASGVMTLLQTTVGLRLSVLQGPAFAFIPPLYAFARQPEMQCQWKSTDYVPEEEYTGRLRMIIGSLLAAGCVQALLGATGLIGILAKRVGPLTICPLMLLLCIGNVPIVLQKSSSHWISLIQFGFLLLFVFYTGDLKVPILTYHDGHFKVIHFRLFGTFPYLISILLVCSLAAVLTYTDIEPREGVARVDRSLNVIRLSPWIQIPYPGQFGLSSINFGLLLGLLSSCIACSIESLGAYQTLSRVSEEVTPPSHSLNRATLIQGIGCILSSLMGCSVGITAYSENIAVVAITKMASRRIIQFTGLIFIMLGVFTKFAALAASVPDPIVGAVFGMSVCLVTGVSLSNLQNVDLKVSRNLSILGLSIILGIIIPTYIEQTPINTGIDALDQPLNILFATRMFVGGLIAFILDNTSKYQLAKTATQHNDEEDVNLEMKQTTVDNGYDFSYEMNRLLIRIPLLCRLPFMPPKTYLRNRLNAKERETVLMPD